MNQALFGGAVVALLFFLSRRTRRTENGDVVISADVSRAEGDPRFRVTPLGAVTVDPPLVAGPVRAPGVSVSIPSSARVRGSALVIDAPKLATFGGATDKTDKCGGCK